MMAQVLEIFYYHNNYIIHYQVYNDCLHFITKKYIIDYIATKLYQFILKLVKRPEGHNV